LVDYLFVIPLTPEHLLSNERRALKELCFKQIKKLRSSYKVYLLGRSDYESENFEVFDFEVETKEDKLYDVGKLLIDRELNEAKYLVRLDDDDLINPTVFDELSAENFDIAFDEFHWFYDLTSGQTSAQKREWIANTAIISMHHALTRVDAVGGTARAGVENFLFACDHSRAWHLYFKDKNVRVLGKNAPLYLRILNDQSISARNQSETDFDKYVEYLAGFGDWKANFPLETDIKDKLCEIFTSTGRTLENRDFKKPSLFRRSLRHLTGKK
jgi:hypothetical protein